jgi:transcriptional regulator of arginine metabolism
MKKTNIESALRDLLYRGARGTQSDIVKELKKQQIVASQTSVSRSLKRLRAEKHRDSKGEIVWWLPGDPSVTIASPKTTTSSIKALIKDIVFNDSMIVIHTVPGGAGQVAYLLDRKRPAGILGTIAGDDTVFVAPPRNAMIKRVVGEIHKAL